MDLLEHVKLGNLKDVKSIVNNENLTFDDSTDYNILKTALLCKQNEIAKFLIRKNFRLNKNNLRERDRTPLHIAVKLRWRHIVRRLLAKGASVAVQDSTTNMSPIQLSFSMKQYEITDLMLSYDKGEGLDDIGNDVSHVHIAAARNCVNAIKKYAQLGLDVNIIVNSEALDWPEYTPLHFAVEFRCRQAVEFLLKCGADITAQDKRRNTPLHLAAMLQDETLIDLILSNHQYTNKNPKNLHYLTHFHIACMKNNPKTVYGFLLCGVDVNAKVSSLTQMYQDYTALHFAVIHECTDVIKLLLAHNAFNDTNLQQFLYDVHKTENPEIINLIVSNNHMKSSYTIYNEDILPLHKACMKRDLKGINRLFREAVCINERLPLDASRWPGGTALHIAVESIHMENLNIVRRILEKEADITIMDARGKTPLHIAFDKHYHALATLLKKHLKFRVNPTDKEGLSHFHIACTHSDIKLIHHFLSIGVDINAAVNLDSLKYPGYTPLHMAIDYHQPKIAKELIKFSADIMIENGLGLTAFDLLLKKCDVDEDFFKDSHALMQSMLRIAHIQRITSFDNRGFTLLHLACINQDLYPVQSRVDNLTVNMAIDLKSEIFPGYTALHFAVRCSTDEIIKTLLDHDADPAARAVDGNTPLHLALYPSLNEEVDAREYDDRLFLVDENPFGPDGLSHFHVACLLNKLGIVESFLNRGIDVNYKSKKSDRAFFIGRTVGVCETGLHMASFTDNQPLMLLLLKHGANVNARDAFLCTPLHKACTSLTIKTLWEYGADVNARNYSGDTPLHFICNYGLHPTVFETILEAGADINIENKLGATPLVVLRNIREAQWQSIVLVLARHMLLLFAAGCYVSETNKELVVSKLQPDMQGIIDPQAFRNECYTELQSMRNFRLNDYTTLHDVLIKRNAHDLRLLVVNPIFQNLDDLVRSFSIYGFLIKLQYQRGMKRRKLLEEAVSALARFTTCRLTHVCAEAILQYLSEDEIECVIKAAKID